MALIINAVLSTGLNPYSAGSETLRVSCVTDKTHLPSSLNPYSAGSETLSFKVRTTLRTTLRTVLILILLEVRL